MFEHVINSVYIPSDDVISHRLDEFGGLLSRQSYDTAGNEFALNSLGDMVAHVFTNVETFKSRIPRHPFMYVDKFKCYSTLSSMGLFQPIP